MPKKQTDYSKTVIYKIVCNDLSITDVYVGHTTEFTKRKSQHKCTVSNVKDRSYSTHLYKVIRENGGWDNYSMIEIEKYPCSDSNEARAKERYWYEQLNAKLNIKKPIFYPTDKEQYYESNKESIKLKLKNYAIKNKEKLEEYKQKYNETNRDKIKEYNKQYKEANREVINETQRLKRMENKDKIKAYKKAYREANKDKINEKQRLYYLEKKQQN